MHINYSLHIIIPDIVVLIQLCCTVIMLISSCCYSDVLVNTNQHLNKPNCNQNCKKCYWLTNISKRSTQMFIVLLCWFVSTNISNGSDRCTIVLCCTVAIPCTLLSWEVQESNIHSFDCNLICVSFICNLISYF